MLRHVSGTLLNAAITVVGLKTIPTTVVLGQFIGAIVGYRLSKTITPAELFNDGYPNSTVSLYVTFSVYPRINSIQAVLIELFCTSCMLCAACVTWDPRCAHTTGSTARGFGLSVAAIFFAASPYTRCSMNYVRTFNPAFWNSAWKDQWIGSVFAWKLCLEALLETYAYQVLFAEKKLSKRKSACSIDEKQFNILSQVNIT